MKARTSFVSNSSSSCFIVDCGDAGQVERTMAKAIAGFLDERDGQDSDAHFAKALNAVRHDFDIFVLDRKMPKKRLQKRLHYAVVENYVKEDDWGKVMVADRFENSLDARFGRLLNERIHVEDAVAEAFNGTFPRRLF